MSDLVGNPEDRFSRVAAQIMIKYFFHYVAFWYKQVPLSHTIQATCELFPLIHGATDIFQKSQIFLASCVITSPFCAGHGG